LNKLKNDISYISEAYQQDLVTSLHDKFRNIPGVLLAYESELSDVFELAAGVSADGDAELSSDFFGADTALLLFFPA
jgi:hypothetical protein